MIFMTDYKKQEQVCSALHDLLRDDKSLPHDVTSTNLDGSDERTYSSESIKNALGTIMSIFGFRVEPIQ